MSANAPSVDEVNALKLKFESFAQGHVFRFWDSHVSKDAGLQRTFFDQLASFDLPYIKKITEATLKTKDSDESSSAVAQGSEEATKELKPPPGAKLHSDAKKDTALMAEAHKIIASGQGSVLILAGGAGSRLGYPGPKGKYEIHQGLFGSTCPTLFSMHCHRITRLEKNAGGKVGTISIIIMTSPSNHEETFAHFEENNFFGRPQESFQFFKQNMLPCFTKDGKIMLESAGRVAMAPDGNGGLYTAMRDNGTIAWLRKRGVKYVHAICVDNASVKPLDPPFIGFAESLNADCGSLVVKKRGPHEKVGVLLLNDGKYSVLEYSEISKEQAERVNSEGEEDAGELTFRAGNICNHLYTVDFLEKTVIPNLGYVYHIANKKIAYANEETGEKTKALANNGVKLEKFIFDIFPLSQRMAVLEVPREEHFSPVKNANGMSSSDLCQHIMEGKPTEIVKDSPQTCNQMLTAACLKWLKAAGAKVAGTGVDVAKPVYIDPRVSYSGEGLECFNGKEIIAPAVITTDASAGFGEAGAHEEKPFEGVVAKWNVYFTT
eukprot:g4288.t1